MKRDFLISMSFLLFLMGTGLYYYSTGFFLTRYEIKEKSSLHDLQPGSQFSRAILLLVDALRYDFVFSSNNTEYNYSNQLPIVEQSLESYPSQTFLSEFIADAPTVTMQRIKGITTGSLPTFIDFKDNFHSNMIEEDNLLYQLNLLDKHAIFMGDDTWFGLFSQEFTRAYPFDSFNVRDLHTVDEGVIYHMTKEIAKTDWTLMIGHMLGVDHVGHRYYSNHPEMKTKLQQVNAFIKSIIDSMDDETILFVFGDHGMTDEGNHGGTSRKETNSALFVHAKKPFQTSQFNRKAISQIDIVPTLSILLGLGIPFNNLGAVIPELFTDQSLLPDSLYVNSMQILRYLNYYDTNVKKLPEAMFDEIVYEFNVLEKKYLQGQSDQKGWIELITKSSDMCRSIWTNFDYSLMTTGAITMVVTMLSFIVLNFFPVYFSRLELCCLSLIAVSFLSPILSSCLWLLYVLKSVIIWQVPPTDLFILLGIQVAHGYGLFSNSYVVKEDSVIRFLLQMLVLVCYYKSKNVKLSLLCAICIRLSAATDIITQKENMNNLNVLDAIIMHPLMMTYIPLVVITYMITERLSVFRKILFFGNISGVFMFWFFQDIGVLGEDSVWVKSYIPRIVYVVCLISSVSRVPYDIFAGILPGIIIILGYNEPIVVLCLLVQMYSFEKICSSQALKGLFYAMMVSQYFYATGHRSNFPSLQIASAFIGFEVFNIYVSGILLFVNTLGSALFLIPVFENATEEMARNILLYYVVGITLTALNTAVNRRHLMVWPIFAPKYVFELFTAAAVCAICLLCMCFFYKKQKS